MSRPTLRGRLLASQIIVAAFACVLLVLGAIVAGGTIFRRHQDQTLSSLADAICSGIEHELAEKYLELDMGSAASHFFEEAHIDQHQFELWDRTPSLLASKGDYSDLPAVELSGTDRRCSSVTSSGDWQPQAQKLRLCTGDCGEFMVRVGTIDVLYSTSVRDVAGGLLIALPIALILASIFGWIVAGRLLRPVSRLSDAASALVIEPGMSLGVDAEHRELAQLESAFDALLRRTSDLLEREQRFSSQASHELRTPLTRLQLRLERIRGSTDDPSLQEQVDSALRSTRMLARLTESLLMLARSESGELPQEPVNLCDIARRLSGDHDGLDAPVTVEPMEDEILVTGNEELLTRAVANLIENAEKYAGCHAHVALRAYRQNGEAVISVEDDGPGIPPELRDTALERFRRGAAHRPGIAGVGLGLSVVDAIARRHGGRVELSPGTGGGECVRIYLPAVGLDL